MDSGISSIQFTLGLVGMVGYVAFLAFLVMRMAGT